MYYEFKIDLSNFYILNKLCTNVLKKIINWDLQIKIFIRKITNNIKIKLIMANYSYPDQYPGAEVEKV